MTIAQLDNLRNLVSQKGADINDIGSGFCQCYFSKIFADELSSEYNETLTDQEKLRNLELLYKYAKEKKLNKALRSNLMHEIMQMTVKLGEYRLDLFEEYLELPLE